MIKHGHWAGGRASPEYAAWEKAKHRCHSEKSHAFKDYGGRGISMCDRWRFGQNGLSGFECFLSDMGLRPAKGYSLERVDNDKGYSPGNCVWATFNEQCRNRRSTRWLEFQGEKITCPDIVARTGLKYVTVKARLRMGWSVERIMAEPARPHVMRSAA